MIYTEDQIVKVNGVVLPGLVKSIEVKESAQIDEQEVEGSATKPKQATGYEDAKVNIELILDDTPTQTKYQRLETLRAIFRTPGQSVPKPLSIVSEDTAAHGVDKVLFKGLRVRRYGCSRGGRACSCQRCRAEPEQRFLRGVRGIVGFPYP